MGEIPKGEGDFCFPEQKERIITEYSAMQAEAFTRAGAELTQVETSTLTKLLGADLLERVLEKIAIERSFLENHVSQLTEEEFELLFPDPSPMLEEITTLLEKGDEEGAASVISEQIGLDPDIELFQSTDLALSLYVSRQIPEIDGFEFSYGGGQSEIHVSYSKLTSTNGGLSQQAISFFLNERGVLVRQYLCTPTIPTPKPPEIKLEDIFDAVSLTTQELSWLSHLSEEDIRDMLTLPR